MTGDTMSTNKEIEILLNREVEFEEIHYNGSVGFIPIYFNHSSKTFVSDMFSKTEEESANKFLIYLQTVKPGDTDGIKPSDNDGNIQQD